jgi:predicted TIM-barrel fold metal-dependent hydrolase
MKYPNLYTDTACLYADTPMEFVNFTFSGQIPTTWIERTLRNQVMFGSNYPRFVTVNMVEAVRSLGFSMGATRLIFRENARKFMNLR